MDFSDEELEDKLERLNDEYYNGEGLILKGIRELIERKSQYKPANTKELERLEDLYCKLKEQIYDQFYSRSF